MPAKKTTFYSNPVVVTPEAAAFVAWPKWMETKERIKYKVKINRGGTLFLTRFSFISKPLFAYTFQIVLT